MWPTLGRRGFFSRMQRDASGQLEVMPQAVKGTMGHNKDVSKTEIGNSFDIVRVMIRHDFWLVKLAKDRFAQLNQDGI